MQDNGISRMKTFHERFKDSVDMYLGTAVLTEEAYKSIQKEVLQEALKIVTNDGEYGLRTGDMVSELRKRIESL